MTITSWRLTVPWGTKNNFKLIKEMKKLLFSAVAFATLLFASCQQGNLETAQGNAVTFTVEAPAVVQTKSIADGLNVNELFGGNIVSCAAVIQQKRRIHGNGLNQIPQGVGVAACI